MSELTMMCLGNIKENGVIFGERLNHQSSISVSEMLRLTLTWWIYFNRILYYHTYYHINCGVIQGIPALRKAVTTHVKKYCIFSRVLTRPISC